MDEKILDECYEKAKEVIKQCCTPKGLFASAGKKGYDAVWARDSMISFLGASLVLDKKYKRLFKKTFKKSLITLRKWQSKNGQIPNCVDRWSERKPHTDFQTIDSSLWYVIGNYIYKKRYHNEFFFNRNKKSIEKVLTWLKYQDIGEDGMPEQLPTSDWQDAFPHKYGHTINTQALYYHVLNLAGKKRKAEKLKIMVNKDSDKNLWNENFYVSYRWKNHNKYREIGDWFDSLGNLLSVIFELADRKKSEKILDYIEKNKINKPYPIKAIYPPIEIGSKHWQDYFMDCDARTPYHYLNGGIWGYVGCFYILSLIKLKKFKEAEKELEKLAERNIQGNFPEWTNPITKGHYGKLQAWEAGMYILAYESFKNKKVLI